MAEYIERAPAVEAAAHAWAKGLEPSQYIEIIPAADVAPVKHGRWGKYEAFPLAPSLNGYPCSECGVHIAASAIPVLNYCPNCGAKMDGGEDDG